MPKSIGTLKFVHKPTINRNQDPVVSRRSKFVGGLIKQVALLNGKAATDKIRAWFTPKGNGYVASVRYRNSPIELEGTYAFFEVPNKEALVKVYNAISKEVEAGEWDSLLENKAKSMKKGGGRKKPPVVR